ncbi:MAG: hypothetical protein K8L99_31185 [Anaerolineae bacterium]|nr:hypothetical protein [Anaerolineae bacterium]
MRNERIRQLISQIQAIKEVVDSTDQPPLPKPFIYRCAVRPPVPWSESDVEKSLQVTLPDDLISLWNQTSGLRLYEEISYGAQGAEFGEEYIAQ